MRMSMSIEYWIWSIEYDVLSIEYWVLSIEYWVEFARSRYEVWQKLIDESIFDMSMSIAVNSEFRVLSIEWNFLDRWHT